MRTAEDLDTRGDRSGHVGAAAGPARLTHVPALDGLRGLAVAAVLLYHGGLLDGGFLGVDAFFVLSGYLITALLLREARDAGRIDLPGFWVRRARRLLPVAVVLVGAAGLYARVLLGSDQWGAIRQQGLATLAYVANWQTIFGGRVYGTDLAGRSPLEHTWSLAIEEQFYLVWPLVVVGVLRWRRSPRSVLLAAAAVAVGGSFLLVGLALTATPQNTLYLATPTRTAAMAFGAVIASWKAWRGTPSAPARRVVHRVAVVAALGTAWAWISVDLHDRALYRGGLTACGLAVAAVIWSLVQPGTTVLGRGLSVAPLRSLGLVSYGLYLWHWPIFLVLDPARTGIDGVALFVVRVAASLTVAGISHRVLEQPVRRSRRPRRTVALLSVGAVAVSVLALSAVTAGEHGAGRDAVPSIARAGVGDPVVALYGDSVAYHLGADGLDQRDEDRHLTVVNAARLGCEPLGGVTSARDGFGQPIWDLAWTDCIDSLVRYPDQLDVRPDVAVVLFGGVQWDAEVEGTWRHPCSPAYADAYRRRLAAAITTLRAQGSSVVVVKPAPVLSRRLEDLKGMADGAERARCSWKATEPLLDDDGVSWIDLEAYTCSDDHHCDLLGPDAELRGDGIHYRDSAAERISSWLLAAAVEAAEP